LKAAGVQIHSIIKQLREILGTAAEQRAGKVHRLFGKDLDLTVVMPRSALLALLNQKYPLVENDPNRLIRATGAINLGIRKRLEEASELGNLARVGSEINSLIRPDRLPGNDFMRLNGYRRALGAIGMAQKWYTDFTEGKPFNLQLPLMPAQGPMNGPPGSQFGVQEVVQIENALVRTVLPRALFLPESEAARADETSFTFMSRILREATAREDWQTVKRVLKLSNRWYFWGAVNTADAVGLQRFLLGLQAGEEGRLEDSAYYYLFALQSGSSLVPAERIGRELNTLRREHPAEFEGGATRAVKTIFVESLAWRYKSFGFASFLTPIDEEHEVQSLTQQIPTMVLNVPAPR
jgi:hypothetical protein